MAYSPAMCFLVLQGMIEMVMGAAQVRGPGLGTLVFYVSNVDSVFINGTTGTAHSTLYYVIFAHFCH